MISDLNDSLEEIKQIYNISSFNIIKNCANLIMSKGFNYFEKNILPLKHQILLKTKVEEYFDEGFFIIVNSVIGAGKTTGLFGLIEFVKQKKLLDHPSLEILYICNIESNRQQFLNMCECANLKSGEFKSGKFTFINEFGVKVTENRSIMCDSNRCNTFEISHKGNKTFKTLVKSSNNNKSIFCFSDKCITITNLIGAIELLSNCDPDKYIVCFDEPNDEAHNIHSYALQKSMEIIRLFTKRSILLSGTFPNPSLIDPIIQNVKLKYQDVNVDVVNTQEITTGCLTINYENGNVFLPYYGATNKQELLNVIYKLESSPFLSRSCENNVLCHLYETLCRHSVLELNYLDNFFNELDEINAEKIKLKCIELLKLLSNCDNEIIKHVCAERLILDPLNITNLGTFNAHKLLGQTIIATINPVDATLNMFSDLLTNINNQIIVLHSIESINSNIGNHDVLLYGLPVINQNTDNNYFDNIEEEFNSDEEFDSDKEIDNNEKINSDKNNKYIQKEKTNNQFKTHFNNYPKTYLYKNYTSAEKIYKRMVKYYNKIHDTKKYNLLSKIYVNTIDKKGLRKNINLQELLKPTLFFNNEFQINSKEHCMKYASNNQIATARQLNKINPRMFSTTRVNDDIISLFLAGVGIYDLNDSRLDKPYLDLVLDYALQGNLNYIISNRDICYGVSMPVYNVISLDNFSEQSSIYDIGQLSGRAGRRNKSTSATLYLGNTGFEKYLSYAKNIEEEDQCIHNMLSVFEQQCNKNNLKIES